jgi:hypothetical protein
MATARGSNQNYFVGSVPPRVTWTVVRGDTASFRVYVTDDEKQAIDLTTWSIKVEIKRPETASADFLITDDAEIILTLIPSYQIGDPAGEFLVSLTAAESAELETGDIFDIELRTVQDQTVWTVAQGRMVIIEDVTN